jgi:hypothetical protein
MRHISEALPDGQFNLGPRKNKAPLEGRAGPSSRRYRLLEGTNSEREEEEGDALSRCRRGI